MGQLIYIALLMLFVISACHKDEPAPTPPVVDYYAQRSTLIADNAFYKGYFRSRCFIDLEYRQVANTYNYFNPILNPNNSFEFCYTRSKKNADYRDISDLYKYNFCTGTSTLISQNCFGAADWSIKDWIIYTDIVGDLWKIKSNGDSLIRLTFTRDYNTRPKWNVSGTKYLYYDISVTKLRISNEDGTFNRTVNVSMSNWTWENDSTILYLVENPNGGYTVGKYRLNNNTNEFIMNVEGNVAGRVSVKNNIIYYTVQTGMYKIENNNLSLVDTCYLSYFGRFLQHPIQPNRYIINRYALDTVDLSKCIIYENAFISILDKNNNTERRVNIPE